MSVAAAVGSGLVNGLTRVIFGLLVDKYSFRALFCVIVTSQLVNALACFWAAKWAPAFFMVVVLNYF